uniref:U-box domain-containing protein n=1 Tax=viral metagenome TaxID=1070528 RepID=A0A6C0HU72_9ZZZZ
MPEKPSASASGFPEVEASTKLIIFDHNYKYCTTIYVMGNPNNTVIPQTPYQDTGINLLADNIMDASVSTLALPHSNPTATPLTEFSYSSLFTKGTEPYNDWICPISLKLMVDPVVAQDGYSYERKEIETWLLKKNPTSPKDRSPINDKTLYTNIGLKGIIQEWKKQNPELVNEYAQLDRQVDILTLRVKPVARPIVTQPSFITQIGQRAFAQPSLPGWNVIHDLLSRSNSQHFSPRISQVIRNHNSSRVSVQG